jgi:hypothetical protein
MHWKIWLASAAVVGVAMFAKQVVPSLIRYAKIESM